MTARTKIAKNASRFLLTVSLTAAIVLVGCGAAPKDDQMRVAKEFCAPANVKTIDFEEDEGNVELKFECVDGRHSE